MNSKRLTLAVLFVAGLCMQEIFGSLFLRSEKNIDRNEYDLQDQSFINTSSAIPPCEMQYNCGDIYEITEKTYEYSPDTDMGMIVPYGVELLRDQENKNGKIPVKVTYSSKSKPLSADNPIFKNYTDPTEFLESPENGNNHLADVYLNNSYELLYKKVTKEQIISYNEFYGSDGIRHRVIFHQTGSESTPYWWIIKQTDSGFCWRDKVSSNSFKYDGDFTLQLEDYNNDGIPDYIYKADDPDEKGCRYILQYTDGDSSLIYIYGETSDAPRLDRIDRDNFFLFTPDEYGFPKPQILNSDRQLYDTDDRENNGWIFTSSYENGVITLKGTAVAMYRAKNNPHTDIAVKRLDELVWRDVDIPVSSAELTVEGSQRSSSMTVDKELEQGIYRIEVTVNGKMTYTEFIVSEWKNY